MGNTYGRLTILGPAEPHVQPSGQRKQRVVAQCTCGTVKEYFKYAITCGNTTSCGCAHREATIASNTKHGHYKNARSRTYIAWANMKKRCGTARNYEHIAYDPAWDDFTVFLADMGECPEGLTIDRSNNTEGYSRENCRWATMLQQVNNRRNTTYVTIGDETDALANWCRRLGKNYRAVRSKMQRGSTALEALGVKL